MTVGQRIKNIRKKKNMTQKELGELLGTTQQMIGLYESGKHIPKLESIRRVAQALNVPVLQLLDDEYEFKQAYRTEGNKREELTNISAKNTSLFDSLATEKEKWALDKITESLKRLSPSGQEEAVNRIEELTHLPRYQKHLGEEPE